MSSFNRTDTTANRLRMAMEQAGKRQTDLVKETGIDKGAMSNYLKGKYEPKQDVVYKLAVALNVSEMWVWGYDCKRERSDMQKKNDTLSDIVVRMRTDDEFLSVVEAVHKLEPEKLSSLLAFLRKLLEALANVCSAGSRKYWWQINMALTFS